MIFVDCGTPCKSFHFRQELSDTENFKIAAFKEYSYFRLSENKTINVFTINYIVQLSKLTSQWTNKYLTLRLNKWSLDVDTVDWY